MNGLLLPGSFDAHPPATAPDDRPWLWLRFEDFEGEIGTLMREAGFYVASRDLDGDGTVENLLGSSVALLDDLAAACLRVFGVTV